MGVLVLLLGGVYDHLLSTVSLQNADGSLSTVEALLLFVLVGGLLVGAMWETFIPAGQLGTFRQPLGSL